MHHGGEPPASAKAPSSPAESDVWSVEGSSFVGRAGAMRELEAHFEDGARLVTIFGTAGLGKTRLLRRFGASMRDRGTSVFWCDLKAATSLVGILDVVAGALGVPLTTSASAEEASTQLGHAIGARGPVLLLLDNFEQIAAHAEATLGTWLRRAPAAALLVTSRETLGLEEEVCFELLPLEAHEGAALFEDRARQVRPDLSLSVHDRERIAEIAERLDHLPLALELAAARMAVLSPSEIAARLSKRFELLRSTRRDVPPRHATLEGAIAWSWRSLSPWEQAALAQCTVFRGGFSLPAAEAVLDLSGIEGAPPALDALHALREKSLVRCQLAHGSPSLARFSLYESIREFAAPELGDDARRAAEGRHARFFVEEAERWAALCSGPRHQVALDALSAELANLHRVAELHQLEPELALRAALALDRLLAARGPLPTRLALLEHVAPALDRVACIDLRVRYLSARADARRTQEKLAEACADLDLALALAREHGRAALEGPILLAFGDLAAESNRPGEAEPRYREAAAAARLAGDASTAAAALCNLIDWRSSSLDAIRALVEEVSDLRARPALFYKMGMRAALLGEVVGYELFELASETAGQIGDPLLEARVGYALACAELSRGSLESAAARFEAILPFHREVGYRRFEGLTRVFLGVVRHLQGKDEVRALVEHGLAITAETGERWGEGFAMANLAALDATEGRLARAEGRLEAARQIAEELGDPSLSAVMHLLGGVVDLARSRRAAGEGRDRDAAAHAASARERLARMPGFLAGAARLGALFAGPVLERALARAEVSDLDTAYPASAPREPAPSADLELGPEGAWFRVRGGERVSMRRRHAMRRLLMLLVEQRLAAPGRTVTPAALIAAGWPGERMLPSAAANRLHNAVAVLRSLGLKGLLDTVDDGYALAPVSTAGAPPSRP